jgi:putative permease
MRRVVIFTLVVLLTLTGLLLLWELRLALSLFLFSLAIAAAFRPAVQAFMRRGLGRAPAIILTYLLWLAGLGGLFYLAGALLLLELGEFADDLAVLYERIVSTWPEGTPFQQSVSAQLPPPQDLYSAIAGERGAMLMQNILGVAQGFALVVGQAAFVLVLSIYWSIDQVYFERLWLSLLPARSRPRARSLWRQIEQEVGAYIRSELFQSLLASLVLGLGYAALGLPYPLLAAVTAAVLRLIPWLGAVLALVVPVIISLAVSPALAAAAAVYTLIVLFVMEGVVQPRLFDRNRYSSLLVVILMVAFADAFGVFGLIIAPPLAAALQILGTGLLRKSAVSASADPHTDLQALQTRLDRLRAQAILQEEPAPEMLNLLERIASVIQEAGTHFAQNDTPQLDLPLAREGERKK